MSTPGRGRRVVIQLLLQPGHLVLGLPEAVLEGGPAVEGGRPGAGADAQAVVGDAVQVNQPLLAEHGHRVGQQSVEQIDVADAEVGEGMVVDGDEARSGLHRAVRY